LARRINASPIRIKSFLDIQERPELENILTTPTGKIIPVRMIQDVRTRWNSTVQMLQRAIRLRYAIRDWLKEEKYREFRHLYPTTEEWEQIEYLITILAPFLSMTNVVSTSNSVTISFAFIIYNAIFTRLENIQKLLRRKKNPWKLALIDLIEPALNKLRKYYSLTTTHEKALMMNLGLVCHPSMKMIIYQREEWQPEDDDDEDWWVVYKEEFLRFYRDNYGHNEKPGLCHKTIGHYLRQEGTKLD
jgi:hypothetical protein